MMLTKCMAILASYDVRGLYGEDIDERFAVIFLYKLKEFIRDQLNPGERGAEPYIYVARDSQEKSSLIADAMLSEACCSRGDYSLVDLGVLPVPAVAFHAQSTALCRPKDDSSVVHIMVTASHNSDSCVGFKIMLNGRPFYGEYLNQVLKNVRNCKNLPIYKVGSSKEIKNINSKVLDSYISYLLDFLHEGNLNIEVMWCTKGGAASPLLHKLLLRIEESGLGIRNIKNEVFSAVDPTSDSSISSALDEARVNRPDISFAFDEDGDRLLAILRYRDDYIVLRDDLLFLLFTSILLLEERDPGGSKKVICDVKMSASIINRLRAIGANIEFCKSGHSNFKFTMMNDSRVLLGAEITGHTYFREGGFVHDDPILAAIKLINYLEKYGHVISNILDEIGEEIKITRMISIKAPKAEEMIEKIKGYLVQRGIDFIDIDGIRRDINKSSFWLIRESKTEKMLGLRFEGADVFEFLQSIEDFVSLASLAGFKNDVKATLFASTGANFY